MVTGKMLNGKSYAGSPLFTKLVKILLPSVMVAAGGCMSTAPCSSSVSAAVESNMPEEGFVSIFNGKDLTGWIGAVGMYDVETIRLPACGSERGKEIQVLSCFPERGNNGKPGNLCTEKEYENFILRFEFCMPENGNNGLGLRMTDITKLSSYYGMCELQLLDDGGSKFYDAAAQKDKLKPYQYTGSVYGIVPARRDNFNRNGEKDWKYAAGGSYIKKPGEWNFAEVRVAGSRIQMILNGTMITDAGVSKFKGDGTDTPDGKAHPGLHNKKGHIGWLGHGSHVMWRNIRIKELPSNASLDKEEN